MAMEEITATGAPETPGAPEALEMPEQRTAPDTEAQVAAAGGAGAVRYYQVAPGVQLNVRSGPGTGYRIVRILAEGISVPIYCQRPGETVNGYYGTSNIWDCITNGQYVSDAYVRTNSDGYVAPRCS